jgi:RNA polymerase sigma-70 factor (ECF subfamily)
VHVDAAHFAAHLAGHLGVSSQAAEALCERASDLYLAFAAARGDAHAIAEIDRTCIARLDRAIRGVLPPCDIDDLKQQLRQRLFLGTSDAPPRLLDYAGRGELRAWVRASAVHTAISILRTQSRDRAHQQSLWLAAPRIGVDPVNERVRPQLRVELHAAFETALRSLETRDRNLLRQHFLDGLSTDELARLYRVHRVTAFRWLTRARHRLLSRTRRALAGQLSLGRSELDSIMRLVDSQLDISVSRMFDAAHGAG